MASIKNKDIKEMNQEERDKKLNELKKELARAEVDVAKSGGSKVKQIKRNIAKILTFNKEQK